jgi:hypothetical protein
MDNSNYKFWIPAFLIAICAYWIIWIKNCIFFALRTTVASLATSELEITRYCDQFHILSYHKLWIADYSGTARSKPWVCGHSLAGIAGSNPAGAWMSISCECCVLSDRSLCVGLIIRPEESYRVWCFRWVWSRSPERRGHDPESGRSAT